MKQQMKLKVQLTDGFKQRINKVQEDFHAALIAIQILIEDLPGSIEIVTKTDKEEL